MSGYTVYMGQIHLSDFLLLQQDLEILEVLGSLAFKILAHLKGEFWRDAGLVLFNVYNVYLASIGIVQSFQV